MQEIPIEDGTLFYDGDFLGIQEANALFETLQESVPWRTDKIKIFGKVYDVPRLQAWFGDPDAIYSYSNIDLKPLPWTPELSQLKNRIEELSQASYNSVLINLYRDGSDSNGYHSDDEKELGPEPCIASITLGQERMFHMKHKKKALKKSILLEHGSLLIMRDQTQSFWKHQIPKSKKPMEARINLTFRRIFT